MHTFPLIFLNRTFSFVDQKIVIVRWRVILLLWNCLMSMKFGLKNVKRRKRRKGRVMIPTLVAASSAKVLFGFAREVNGKMMWKLKARDYFWTLMMKKKLVRAKEMGNPCMLGMLSPSWIESVDSSLAGIYLNY